MSIRVCHQFYPKSAESSPHLQILFHVSIRQANSYWMEHFVHLCDAEELPVSPISLTVGRARSVPRKKSLTRQQSESTVPCSKEQQHSKQQVVSCSEQSEDEVTAETSLLPHQVEQPTEEKVSTFSNQTEIIIIRSYLKVVYASKCQRYNRCFFWSFYICTFVRWVDNLLHLYAAHRNFFFL